MKVFVLQEAALLLVALLANDTFMTLKIHDKPRLNEYPLHCSTERDL